MTGSRPPELPQPVTCTRCGHVTPYIEGWMVSAVLHHILAVHGGSMKLMGRR